MHGNESEYDKFARFEMRDNFLRKNVLIDGVIGLPLIGNLE